MRLARRALRRGAGLALCLPHGALAQRTIDPSTLTIDRLFASPEFIEEPFGPARWLPDGESYTTLEGAAGGTGTDIVRYDAASGRRDVLVPATRLVPNGRQQPLDIEDYLWSKDGRWLLVFTNTARVWRQNTRGDYWVLDRKSGALRQLGGKSASPSTLMFATFSPDGRRVAYVRERNLYVEDVVTGRITRLTSDGSRTVINGTFDWVYEEELNDRNGFRWSPDGKRIAYWQLDTKGVRDFDLINNTDSLYSRVEPVQYPKAGTTNSAARVGVVSSAGGPTRWIKLPGDPRQHYIARLEWAGNSSEVVLQRLNRRQNALELILGDAATGTTRTILTERDSAWVDVVDDLRWLNGGKRFTWVSERDGWRHLYVISRDGRDAELVTKGDYDLANPESAFGEPFVAGTDSASGTVYFTASPTNATQLYLFRAPLDGSAAAERVTPSDQPGTHNYDIAPGARWALHTYSSFGNPPVIELVHLPDHKPIRTLVDNAALRRRVNQLATGHSEFLRVDGGDGAQLDAYLMRPPSFDSTKSYPILFNVYGEPAHQTVTDSWGGHEYLWYLMLTQHGYIVASVDNRGTPAPRGRAWRKAIYRQIGILSSNEQTAAAREIVKRPYIDSTRVGVWGWSGGGSMTLNLLFRSPDLYRMGMAVAPVTDLRYYDTIYEERYMGLPDVDSTAYRMGSPITFANQLHGDLLLVHGSGDDNVHYQNSEALVNALVRAGKQFTLMEYPNRTHCICQGRGTYRHLYTLLTNFLEAKLPAK